MQICFANLAAWPLVVLLISMLLADQYFPFQFLSLFLGDENPLRWLLLDASLFNMVATFLILFGIHWFIRQENVSVLILMFLLCAGDMHISLVTVGVFAVYLSRIVAVWKLVLPLHGRVRRVGQSVSFLNCLAWLLGFTLSLFWLHQLLISGQFRSSGLLTRPVFLTAMIVFYYFVTHMLLSVWGHFYFRKPPDPSELHIHYSTTCWMGLLKLRLPLKTEIKELALNKKESHLRHLQDFTELSRQHGGLNVLPIEKVIKQEIIYLDDTLKHLDSV